MKRTDEESISNPIETNVLSSLGTALSESFDMKDKLSKVFDILSANMGLEYATIRLINPVTDAPRIELAHGFDSKALDEGRHTFGEEIVNEVLKTGHSRVVPEIGKFSDKLNKKKAPRSAIEQYSFISVPILSGASTIGAISVLRKFQAGHDFTEDKRLLRFIALMLAQSWALKQLHDREEQALRTENKRLREELKTRYNISNMIGNSSAMVEVYENIMQVANSNATVMIRGESGTGKELVAQALHYNSLRSGKPFVKINCGAIPETLIESELFGYEKGAFTDAVAMKIGKFEAADGGTIFLDEIGELSPMLQVKLLRVLQEREFERVGGISPVKVNVRVVAATHRNLEELLAKGTFREDLYYRLNVFPIFLAPLRERKTDILLLADHFLQKFAKENLKNITRISSLAIDLLMSYHWPGNVRELENCLERAVLLCQSDTIQATHMPPTLQRVDTAAASVSERTFDQSLSMLELVANFERELIIDALKRCKGNQSKAAKYLQISERIIGYKIKNLDIDYNKFKGKT